MAKKKAAIEVQFNWVFVMIAGALILVFFFGIVQKQRQISQAKISNSLLTNIESIATGAAVAKGTVQTVDLPNIGVNFECTPECLCTFSIEDIRKEYQDKIIFAPETVEGAQIILWTLDWNAPFRVANFIYATTANDKYFFVYDNANSALLKMLNRTIPPEVNADFVHFSEYAALENQNYNSAKFVFVDTSGNIPSDLGIDDSFRRTPVTGLYINNGGDAVFYDKVSRRRLEFMRRETSYYGEPAAYGAIFASGMDSYECNMISGLQRLKNIIEIYTERAEMLDDFNNAENFCVEGYSTSSLEQLYEAADAAMLDTKAVKQIGSAVSGVISQNEALLRGSCPLIY
jgi:hypothetical protein